MNVVSLQGFRERDTHQIARLIIRLAEAGSLRGLAVCLKGLDGKESTFITGDYRDDPDASLRACMHLSWELTKLQDSTSPS